MTELEASAAYSTAKSAHAARVARLTQHIEDEKASMAALDGDIR